MKRGIAAVILFLTAYFVVISCNDTSDKKAGVKGLQGRINISVDETFKPVIEEQIKVFRSSWPDAEIIASYKSEADCLRDLQSDSTGMVIIARPLSNDEEKFFNKRLNHGLPEELVAYDAVAFIVNKSSNDSVFTIEQLSSYLNGTRTDKQVIVDNKNASSTVRYLMDSLLKGRSFGKNVVGAENSEQVIDLVAANPNAIGVMGISWIAGRENSNQKANLEKIKTALVECRKCKEEGVFARPSQATVTTAQYPFYRGVYYILKDIYGLGDNFAGFLRYERGQLIFRRAQLVPALMSFSKRKTQISEQE